MFEWIAALQPPLIGAVLVWSAGVKLLSRRRNHTALAKLLGEQRAPHAYRALGGAELALGAVLLWPAYWQPAAAAAAVAGAGFLGYLVYAKKTAPESSCGCMSAKHVPISWRGFARAGWILAAGVTALWATGSWTAAAAGAPVAAVAVMTAQAVLFVTLSPEFDAAWLKPLRRLKVKLRKPLSSGVDMVPLQASLGRLQQSRPYRETSALLRTGVREYWDSGEWRVICYGARYDDRDATAVFAVPLRVDHPEQIRVAVVDEESEAVLLQLEGPDEPVVLSVDEATAADKPVTVS